MLYKVGVLSNSTDAPFSIKDNNNDKSEKSLDNWGNAIGEKKLPFLVTGNDNRFSGIGVDMWKKIANVLKIKYRFVDAGKNHAEAIEKLSKGEYDILVGNLNKFSKMNYNVQASSPFFLSKNAEGVFNKKSFAALHVILKLLLYFLSFVIVSSILHYFILKDNSFTDAFKFTISSALAMFQQKKEKQTNITFMFQLVNTLITISIFSYFAFDILKGRNSDVSVKKTVDLSGNFENLQYVSKKNNYSNLDITPTSWNSSVFLLNSDIPVIDDINKTILYFRGIKKGHIAKNIADKYSDNIGHGSF
jgi:hypothetical protein